MSWQASLVRIAGYEVEQLRKRLASVVDRRVEAELRLALLHAEAVTELARAADPETAWCRAGYMDGWRMRRDETVAHIAGVASEEAGARDALARAFEELKKYEQVEQNAEIQARAVESKLEAAVLDELGARRAMAR